MLVKYVYLVEKFGVGEDEVQNSWEKKKNEPRAILRPEPSTKPKEPSSTGP